MPNQDQLQQESNRSTSQTTSETTTPETTTSETATQQDCFQWQTLAGEDQENYEALNLPSNHPHTLAHALLAQLARMPLLEEQAAEQRPGSPEPIALLA